MGMRCTKAPGLLRDLRHFPCESYSIQRRLIKTVVYWQLEDAVTSDVD